MPGLIWELKVSFEELMLELKAPPVQQVGPCQALQGQCVSWQAQAEPGQKKTCRVFEDQPESCTLLSCFFSISFECLRIIIMLLHLAEFNGGETEVLTVARVKSAEVADKAPAEPAFDRVCTNMTNQGV